MSFDNAFVGSLGATGSGLAGSPIVGSKGLLGSVGFVGSGNFGSSLKQTN